MNKDQDEISYATNKRNIKKQKIVFIGEQYVGKTSIITRFIKDSFDSSHNTTIGIDFVSKNVVMDGKPMRLQLWDTAGQQRFRSLIPSYLRDCQAAFIVFDLTNEDTFNHVTKWLDFVKDHRGQDVLIFAVGNKCDLAQQRLVNYNAANQKFKQLGIQYIEVSAKTGENIENMFQVVCAKLLGLDPKSELVKLQKEKTKTIPSQSQIIEKNVSQKIVKNREQKKKKTQKHGGSKLTIQKTSDTHRIKEKNCC